MQEIQSVAEKRNPGKGSQQRNMRKKRIFFHEIMKQYEMTF